ncbi:CHAP domain-containing protein [Aquimarina sp. AU58]|uniref:CHAP domain-containing protein n=1 Tax=Aquimarina sp. AU58 TaxID=1874112 RepID=UPI000D6DDC82|nr:CHAP domain-containing protein [Aquimarina sp. AU58]
MKPQEMKIYFSIFFIAIFLFTSCSKEDTITSSEEIGTELDFEYYKIDLSKPHTDLSKDDRFKNLTSEQILTILEYYSPGTTSTSKQNCNNCVHHVRSIDSRLMPVDSGCDTHYKWTNTGCLKGKMKLINSCNPTVGSAVIMDTGIPEGHVAYVEKIVYQFGDPLLKINEGNRPSGVCRTVWLSVDDPMIKGYQNPNRSINCSNAPFYACASPYSSC